MSVLFVVDPLDGLDPAVDTSIGMMIAAQTLGHDIWVTSPSDLSFVRGVVRSRVQQIHLHGATETDGHRWCPPQAWYRTRAVTDVAVEDADLVLMRVEPPVDDVYQRATYLLDLVNPRRVQVVNDPRGLRRANEKVFALQFPDLCPATLVTADAETIDEFVRSHGCAVLKPVDGFAGRGVLLLRVDDLNVGSIVETATALGRRQVIVQEFLPDVEAGNKRLIVLDGDIVGALLRRPGERDFRIGPPDAAAPITTRDRHIVSQLRLGLRRNGLRFVGLDVIGPHLIEINVTCPGALYKADALLGTDYCREVVAHLLEQPAAYQEAS